MIKTFHDPLLQQVTFLDERHYTNDGGKTWVPSVTEILDIYPKGFGFTQWLKDVGSNATEIAERAATQGSKIHQAAELLSKGEVIKWADDAGTALYTKKEWEMLLHFQEFWDMCTPDLIATELSMVSVNLGYGGTIDLVMRIADVVWLLDIKSSNYLHKSHHLQTSAYAMMWNEANPDTRIEETGILWLNANTRTQKIDINAKTFQGEGWQIAQDKRHYTATFKIFEHTQAIYKEENPICRPLNLVYPDTISLGIK